MTWSSPLLYWLLGQGTAGLEGSSALIAAEPVLIESSSQGLTSVKAPVGASHAGHTSVMVKHIFAVDVSITKGGKAQNSGEDGGKTRVPLISCGGRGCWEQELSQTIRKNLSG